MDSTLTTHVASMDLTKISYNEDAHIGMHTYYPHTPLFVTSPIPSLNELYFVAGNECRCVSWMIIGIQLSDKRYHTIFSSLVTLARSMKTDGAGITMAFIPSL